LQGFFFVLVAISYLRFHTDTVLIHLYGPDSYRRREKLHALVSEYRKKHALGDVLDVDLESEPNDWKRVRDFLNQPSMFDEVKASIVRESGEVDEKAWREFLKSHIETPKTFVFISNTGNPTKPFAFLLGDTVMSQEFPKLSGRLLEAFLKKGATERGLAFAPEAWAFLLEYLGEQADPTWMGINELDRVLFSKFPQPVTLEHIRTLIDWLSRRDVSFSARQMLSMRDLGKRLLFLETLLVQRESPGYIFNSLAYQATGDTARTLAEYDVSVKSGKLEYEEALLGFVIGNR
jgi:DNA polymerase III delta subunit